MKEICLSNAYSEFPSCWKIANVQPVPMKYEVINANKNRLIVIYALQSYGERNIYVYLNRSELFSDQQDGYR